MRLPSRIIATACVGLMALPLYAAANQDPGARCERDSRFPTRLDADGSGGISLDELEAAARHRQWRVQHPKAWAKVFAAADTDNDGELAATEFPGFARGLFRCHFKQLDADDSGEITLAEFQAHHQQRQGRGARRGDDTDDDTQRPGRRRRRLGPAERFARADTDNSGGLNPEELRKARRARRKHRRGGSRRGPAESDG